MSFFFNFMFKEQKKKPKMYLISGTTTISGSDNSYTLKTEKKDTIMYPKNVSFFGSLKRRDMCQMLHEK